MKKLNKTDSLYWKHLKLGNQYEEEHEGGHEYDFGKSYSVQEITAYMTPAISSMTVMAVMHALLAYMSAYKGMTEGNDIAKGRSIGSLQWLISESFFPAISGDEILFKGCVCPA